MPLLPVTDMPLLPVGEYIHSKTPEVQGTSQDPLNLVL